MTDDELVDNIIGSFRDFENWDPWHDFKFAEAAGLNMTFFIRAIQSSLASSNDWAGGPVPDTLVNREIALRALRRRARLDCGLGPEEPEDRAQTWQRFFDAVTPAPMGTPIVGKRGTDFREYSDDEVDDAVRKIEEKFPDIANAIRSATHHNLSVNPNFVAERNPDVQTYLWTLDPIKVALRALYPNFDSLDRGTLARLVFSAMRNSYAEAL